MPPEISSLSLEKAELPAPSAAGKLPIALLGASGHGAFHLKELFSLKKRGLIELAAVADPAISRLQEVRANLEEQQVAWYEEPKKLFQQERKIKAISITAPIPWHDGLCRAALEQDLYVFLEKPPVPLIQQWDSLLRLDASRRIAVAFQNIASLPIQTLKHWCVEGRLGKIETIRIAAAWRRKTKYYERSSWAGKLLLEDVPVLDGPATNALAHVLHDAMFLASPQPSGFAVPLEVKAELYRARPIESYDTCCLRALLEGGIELTAALTHACEETRPYKIVVTGSRGKAWIGADGTRLENDQGWPNIEEPSAQHRSRCYENFILYALGRRPRPDTLFADTRGYVLLTNGMVLSSGTIHTIPAAYKSVVDAGQEETYVIAGVLPLLQTTLERGLLFSEQGVPWAVGGQTQSVRQLSSLSLKPCLPALP
ncbi:MAG: Gfo/Idh/MocA family oxidoreductase [Methylacidiphilales bacterium]|nr:Gfo/Idh/MocA family oxidoreductase [Candidatus Methylacidiphilales bacterium]